MFVCFFEEKKEEEEEEEKIPLFLFLLHFKSKFFLNIFLLSSVKYIFLVKKTILDMDIVLFDHHAIID